MLLCTNAIIMWGNKLANAKVEIFRHPAQCAVNKNPVNHFSLAMSLLVDPRWEK